MTPYYDDGQCVIYHGDAREILPTITQQVSLVATDPPYGIGWKPRVNHQDQPWKDERLDITFALVGERHCVWGGNYFELEERYCEVAANRLAQGALDFGGAA